MDVLLMPGVKNIDDSSKSKNSLFAFTAQEHQVFALCYFPPLYLQGLCEYNVKACRHDISAPALFAFQRSLGVIQLPLKTPMMLSRKPPPLPFHYFLVGLVLGGRTLVEPT